MEHSSCRYCEIIMLLDRTILKQFPCRAKEMESTYNLKAVEKIFCAYINFRELRVIDRHRLSKLSKWLDT